MATIPAVPPAALTVAGNKILSPRVQKIAAGLNSKLPSWTITILDQDQWGKWKQYNPHSDKTDGMFSLLGAGRTFISQDWLTSQPDAKIRYNLAHELGHLTLNTADEVKANKFADDLTKPQPSGSITGIRELLPRLQDDDDN